MNTFEDGKGSDKERTMDALEELIGSKKKNETLTCGPDS